MLHLTYTGAQAGTYLCLRYRTAIGQLSVGQRGPGDRTAHYAYAPAALLDDPDLCPDCRHVAHCDTAGTSCATCARLGYDLRDKEPTP